MIVKNMIGCKNVEASRGLKMFVQKNEKLNAIDNELHKFKIYFHKVSDSILNGNTRSTKI